MRFKHGAVAVLLAAVGVGVGHQAHAALVFGQSGDADATVEVRKPKQLGIILDHVMVDPVNPGEIVPCVKVLKKLLQRAQHHPELTLRISVTYYSSGVVTQKLVVIPLREMELTDHHEQPANRKWRLVETVVDISEQPVDVDQPVSGTAELLDDGQVAATYRF